MPKVSCRAQHTKVTAPRCVRSMKSFWDDGFRATPGITEPRCHVCMSPYRGLIEFYILQGQPRLWIAGRMPPDERGRKLDRRSVTRHYEKHMFVRSPLRRRGS